MINTYTDRIELVMNYEQWEKEQYERAWKKAKTFLLALPLRFIGAIMILGNWYLTTNIDGEFFIGLLVTVPLGLFLVLARSKTLLYSSIISW